MAKSAKPISLERSVEKEYITHIHMSLNFFTLYTYPLVFPDIKILTGILRMRIFKTRPLKLYRNSNKKSNVLVGLVLHARDR